MAMTLSPKAPTYGYHPAAAGRDPSLIRRTELVGVVSFNGQGRWSTEQTLSLNGQIINGALTGTYAVNPDCTFTLTNDDGTADLLSRSLDSTASSPPPSPTR